MDEVEQRARDMGWVPQDQFRQKDKWVDAETFVRRGEEITPILKANNRKLEEQLAAARGEVQRLAQMFQASQESITELQTFHEQNLTTSLANQKKQLLAQLADAREEGDVVREVEIQDELAELRERPTKVEKKVAPQTPQQPAQPQVDPAIAEWQKQNTWFGVDPRRTQKAIGVANLISADMPELSGHEFTAELSRRLANDGMPTQSKVGGGRPSGQSGGMGGGGSGYDSLPPDARDACDRQAKKLVGEGRAFKDVASWQSYYAKIYFKGEQS